MKAIERDATEGDPADLVRRPATHQLGATTDPALRALAATFRITTARGPATTPGRRTGTQRIEHDHHEEEWEPVVGEEVRHVRSRRRGLPRGRC